jgi:serine carboxypeptidase-like clade 2
MEAQVAPLWQDPSLNWVHVRLPHSLLTSSFPPSLALSLSLSLPVYPVDGGKALAQNQYSWNTVANVIFLESPSGVGFSYSDTHSDYTTGDHQTTQDTLQFLLKFFAIYDQFASNDFWITGESYGGHYVPWLARAVIQWNDQSPANSINLKGFMVGNAWTDPLYDNRGAVTFWAQTGIISNATFTDIITHCNFSDVGPFVTSMRGRALLPGADCSSAISQASKEMGNINLYDIYVEMCLGQEEDGEHFGNGGLSAARKSRQHSVSSQDPCIDLYLTDYLRRGDVIEAIHASQSPNTWSECSGLMDYSRVDLLAPVIPLYQQFFEENKIRILVYSGDVDGVVPHTGTEEWLASKALGLTLDKPFEAWKASNGQVGGYRTVYKQMTYATVRGAGHMVPGTQPLYALDMFKAFLSGQL